MYLFFQFYIVQAQVEYTIKKAVESCHMGKQRKLYVLLRLHICSTFYFMWFGYSSIDLNAKIITVV